MTQQKRKLRIYISNTYTPSKPDGEEAEKVSSWELRVEGKLLEEVSEQTQSLHLNVLALFHYHPQCGLTPKYFRLCYCVSSQPLSSGWLVSLALTTQPDVCLQLSPTPPHNSQNAHTQAHALF